VKAEIKQEIKQELQAQKKQQEAMVGGETCSCTTLSLPPVDRLIIPCTLTVFAFWHRHTQTPAGNKRHSFTSPTPSKVRGVGGLVGSPTGVPMSSPTPQATPSGNADFGALDIWPTKHLCSC